MPFLFTNSTADLFGAHAGAGREPAAIPADVESEVLGLFDLLRDSLLRYAMSFGISVDDGEDVLQETFLALFRHLMAGRSRGNLRSWLFSVVHNQALRRRTTNQSRDRIHDADPAVCEGVEDRAPSPEAEVLFTERQARLRAVWRALGETDRWCLQLRAEGLRYREIAGVVGISLGSVSASLARSLERMERIDA